MGDKIQPVEIPHLAILVRVRDRMAKMYHDCRNLKGLTQLTSVPLLEKVLLEELGYARADELDTTGQLYLRLPYDQINQEDWQTYLEVATTDALSPSDRGAAYTRGWNRYCAKTVPRYVEAIKGSLPNCTVIPTHGGYEVETKCRALSSRALAVLSHYAVKIDADKYLFPRTKQD